MWIYRALDEDGCYMAEAYREEDLILKLIDEFGEDRLHEFKIIRIYDKTLK